MLHLFSMAGVAEIMCKYGAGDKVLQLKQLDPFGFHSFYGVTEMFDDLKDLIKRANELSREYDKIIIHDYSELRLEFHKSKVILIFHGTKLRQMPESERKQLENYPCYVTTSDLLPLVKSNLLLVPIDLDHFKNSNIEHDENTWIAINRSYQRDFIEKDIKSIYPKVRYYERNAQNIIDYEDMPHFLEQFGNYVDMKYTYDKPEPKYIDVHSSTGLQALAMGCKLWNKFGEVKEPLLLLIHDGKRVTERFLKDFED